MSVKFILYFTVWGVFPACSSPSDQPEVGKKLYFLQLCDSDNDCGELACVCGSCTARCDMDDTCRELGDLAVCNDTRSKCTGGGNYCEMPCIENADCALDYQCITDRCVKAQDVVKQPPVCDQHDECELCSVRMPLSTTDCGCLGCANPWPVNRGECVDNISDYQDICGDSQCDECTADHQSACVAGACGSVFQSVVTCGVIRHSSNLPGVSITIQLPKCEFSREELAQGIEIQYEVNVRRPIANVVLSSLDGFVSDCDSAVIGDNWMPNVTISNGSQRYCYDCPMPDSRCERTSDVMDMAVGRYYGSFSWDGRTGGESWSTEVRDSFAIGLQTVSVTLTGQVVDWDGFELSVTATTDLVISP